MPCMAMERRSVSGKDRYAKVVFDRKRTNDEYEHNAGDVADIEALHADKGKKEIEQASGGTGARIKFLAEDERHFIDADVAHDAAEDCRHHAQDDCAPRLITVEDRLLQANDHEKRDGDGVEEKPGDLSADEPPPEHANRNHRQRGSHQIQRIGHPKRLDAQQHVAERPAAHRSDEADYARAKPVEMLHARKAHPGNGTCKGADKFKHTYEERDFVRKVWHTYLQLSIISFAPRANNQELSYGESRMSQFQSPIGNWQHWNWHHSHIGNTSARPFDSFADKVSGEDLVKSVADEDGRAEELVRIIRDPSAKLLDGPVLLLDGDVARPERLDGLV